MADQSVLLTQLVVLGAQVALLALLARITLAVLLLALARTAGSGRFAVGLSICALRICPRVLRGALRTTLGTGVAVGLACAPAAAAPDPSAVPLLDRGSTSGSVLHEVEVPPRADAAQPPQVEAGPTHYRVRAGDSLWSIAAARIGPDARPGEVARAWPRWHAVNRARIGPDPAVLRVGDRLIVPPRWRTDRPPAAPAAQAPPTATATATATATEGAS